MTPRRSQAGTKGLEKTLEQHIRTGTYNPDRHGPIPEHLDRQIFGPKSAPPLKMPSGLGRWGIWAWKFVCQNGCGLTQGDYLGMEIAVTMFAEWKRIKTELRAIKQPFGRGSEKYEKLTRMMMQIADRLEKSLTKLGLNPAARMKMFSATNMRMANAMAKNAQNADNESGENELEDVEADLAAPVKKTNLDLFRPDFGATG